MARKNHTVDVPAGVEPVEYIKGLLARGQELDTPSVVESGAAEALAAVRRQGYVYEAEFIRKFRLTPPPAVHWTVSLSESLSARGAAGWRMVYAEQCSETNRDQGFLVIWERPYE